MPPITSATTVMVGSSRSRAKSVVSTPFRRVGVAGGIAHERRGHLDRLAGDALDRLGALPQQPVDGGADGAVSEQSDPDG